MISQLYLSYRDNRNGDNQHMHIIYYFLLCLSVHAPNWAYGSRIVYPCVCVYVCNNSDFSKVAKKPMQYRHNSTISQTQQSYILNKGLFTSYLWRDLLTSNAVCGMFQTPQKTNLLTKKSPCIWKLGSIHHVGTAADFYTHVCRLHVNPNFRSI